MNAVETIQTDVIVVGGGGSGLAAAIEARSIGREVVLLEKNPKLGGSTARSVGSVTATNTPHQLRKGILDCTDDHFHDMGLFCERKKLPDNLEMRRILIENVPETFRWLLSFGVVFYGPMPEPPHRKPRMHNVLPNSRAYIYHLERRARKLRTRIITSARMGDLIVENGRVVGVEAEVEVEARRLVVRARGGVVLTTGDFGGNQEMRSRYISNSIAAARPINPTNTGDGHRKVLELGGRIINGTVHIAGIRFDPPPNKWIFSIPPIRPLTLFMARALDHMPPAILRPFVMSFLTTVLQSQPGLMHRGGLLINRDGERFTNELGSPADDIPNQPDQFAYILLDGDLVRDFSGPPHHISTAPGIAYAYIDDYRRNRKDVFHQAETLAGLGQKVGMRAGVLERTVADYNAGLAPAGASPRGDRKLIGSGPYVALGPVRYYITFSDSGVAVDLRYRVLGHNDAVIPSLYAAGFIGMGGMLLEGLGHHLGWGFTSGRRAGRHAAQQVVTADLAKSA